MNQHILSIPPINTPCHSLYQHSLSTHAINAPYQYTNNTPITHPINTFYQPNICPHPLTTTNTPSITFSPRPLTSLLLSPSPPSVTPLQTSALATLDSYASYVTSGDTHTHSLEEGSIVSRASKGKSQRQGQGQDKSLSQSQSMDDNASRHSKGSAGGGSAGGGGGGGGSVSKEDHVGGGKGGRKDTKKASKKSSSHNNKSSSKSMLSTSSSVALVDNTGGGQSFRRDLVT